MFTHSQRPRSLASPPVSVHKPCLFTEASLKKALFSLTQVSPLPIVLTWYLGMRLKKEDEKYCD